MFNSHTNKKENYSKLNVRKVLTNSCLPHSIDIEIGILSRWDRTYYIKHHLKL